MRTVGHADFVPLDRSEDNLFVRLNEQSERIALGYRNVGAGFFQTYGLTATVGRVFEPEFNDALITGNTGENAQRNVVINTNGSTQAWL